jgi:stearoyl-CoA desaturase (delta-9 desaturase)
LQKPVARGITGVYTLIGYKPKFDPLVEWLPLVPNTQIILSEYINCSTMVILVILLIHWYCSLFFQTFFCHRYAAHRQFTMSPFWEKTFYISSWFFQGFTSLSPYAYGILHRMHHAYADTEKDVHSPKYDKSIIAMMVKTDRTFRAIRLRKYDVEERFSKNVPRWEFMEKYAYTWTAKISWVFVYTFLYYLFVPNDALWMWSLLPLNLLMTPLQGVIINWFAHVVGYTNYKVSDTSKNLIPFDFLMMGEGYRNNHHAEPHNANFSRKWYELDPSYRVIQFFNFMGIVKLRGKLEKG